MIEVTAGIDIGGTNSVLGLVDRKGNIFTTLTVPTRKNKQIESFVEALNQGLSELLNKEDFLLRGVGIGAPNANYYRGTIENASNLPWKGILPFRELFEKKRQVSFALTNDANAAAVGEMIYGGAQGMKNFIILTLGTGLGSGLVVNGEVLYGHTGFAGELGHINMVSGGRECGCGKQGCLETYVSATGICRTVSEILAFRNGKSMLREFKYDELDSKIIADFASKGDAVALEAFEKTAEMLARAIVNAVAFSSPEAIFLFGGLAKAGDLLMKPLQKHVDQYIQVYFRDSFQVKMSGLEENNAAVLGASALAWKEIEF